MFSSGGLVGLIMADVTQMIRLKKKRRNLQPHDTDEAFFYPNNKSLHKDEHETLDSIYSDSSNDNFWKEETRMKPAGTTPFSMKLKWFSSGAVLASLIWLIYFQVSVHQIKSTHGPKVVFQTAATIVTDKNFDKEISKTLGNEPVALASVNDKPEFKIPFFSDFFAQKPQPVQPIIEVAENISETTSETVPEAESTVVPQVHKLTHHVIKNGDSLWLIAKEYYGNPSPENIEKIKQANPANSSYLYPGKQIVIPL